MSNDPNNNAQSCSMTGLLGIIIQIALGILSFSVLVIKRFRQKPQRPWKIWVFDTSKQLISQLIAHFINLTISIALSYNDQSADECLWYFMTNILDNTLGVLICILCLRGIEWSLKRRNQKQYISGNYYSKKKMVVQIQIMDFTKGEVKENIEVDIDHSDDYTHKRQMHEEKDQKNQEEDYRTEDAERRNGEDHQNNPNHTQVMEKYQINYKAWLVQLLIWVSVVVIGKSALFGFQYSLKEPLKNFSVLIMGWIQNFPVLELLVVMVLVPVIMNGLAFWVQDNFLMKRDPQKIEGESPLIEQQNTTQRQPPLQL